MGTTQQRGSRASELAASAASANSASGAPVEAESIGRYLARERKVREIDLDELVALTRLPRRSLERLEAGEMDGVSDGFTRGLVRTVAEALGLPVDDTVARMLPEASRGDEGRSWLPSLGILRVVPLSAWIAAVVLLVVSTWLLRGLPAATPEPLLYRRDAVRELWLLQQQHSSWSPAPALATSPSPTVEPESPRPLYPEDDPRSP